MAGEYLNSPTIPRPVDFLQVWAAGRLHLAGENPYDAARMLELQRANRLADDRASMMWNPPWALALVMPVGALPVNAAQGVWLCALAGMVLASAVVLWRQAGGAWNRAWVPTLVALAFAPTWFLLVGGQIVAIVLFGVTGFLVAARNNRPVLAGACAALTAVKPHLLVPFAVGLLIDAARTPFGRRVVLGGLLVGAVAAGIATIPNPSVWEQYARSATGSGSQEHKALADWVNPTLGAWVREAVPGRPFWVQWLPCAVAAVVFGLYWARQGGPDRWPAALPWVVPLGLLTAPYGSWMCDQVLLLVPIVAVLAAWETSPKRPLRVWLALGVYVAANIAGLAMMFGEAGQEYYVWFAPVIVACLWLARSPRGPIHG